MATQSKVAGTGKVDWAEVTMIVAQQAVAPRPVSDAQLAAVPPVPLTQPPPAPIVVPPGVPSAVPAAPIPLAPSVAPVPPAAVIVAPVVVPPVPALDTRHHPVPPTAGAVAATVVQPAAPAAQPVVIAQPMAAAATNIDKGKGKRLYDEEEPASTLKKRRPAEEQTNDDTQMTDPPPPARKPAAPRTRKPKDPANPPKPKRASKKLAPTVDSDDVVDPEAAEVAQVGKSDTVDNEAPKNINEIWKVRYKQAKTDMIYEAHGTVGDTHCGGCISKDRPACWTVRGLSCIFCKKSKIKCNREPRHRPERKPTPKQAPVVAPGTPDEHEEDIGVHISRLEHSVFRLLADREKEVSEEVSSLKQENESLRAFIAQHSLAPPAPPAPSAPTVPTAPSS